MKKTSNLIIICLLTFSLFIYPKDVFACSPILKTPQQMFNSSDAVFTGKVFSVTSTSSLQTVVDFAANAEVKKSWKGNATGTVKIISKAFATCPSAFTKSDEGKTRLIYATKTSNTNEYSISMIHMKDINYAQKDIAFLDSIVSSTSTSSKVYVFNRNLKQGLSGHDVVKLQEFLEKEGFLIMPKDLGKGYFGSLTKKALIEYQKSQKITPAVGFFGKTTQSYITR